MRWDHEMRSYVRSLVDLRARERAIRHGSTVAIGANGSAVALERRLDSDRLIVAVNSGDDAVDLDAAIDDVERGTLESIHSTGAAIESARQSIVIDAGRTRIPLQARTGLVLRVALAGD
jgi:hypothetical protein